MTPDELINFFSQKIYNEQLKAYKNDSDDDSDEKLDDKLVDIYFSMLSIVSKDYASYQKYIPQILSTLENNDLVSISYSISVFYQLYISLILSDNKSLLDITIINEKISDDASKIFLEALRKTFATNNRIRVSDFDFKGDDFTEKQKRESASLLIKIVQDEQKR